MYGNEHFFSKMDGKNAYTGKTLEGIYRLGYESESGSVNAIQFRFTDGSEVIVQLDYDNVDLVTHTSIEELPCPQEDE